MYYGRKCVYIYVCMYVCMYVCIGMTWVVPSSARWLAMKGRINEARHSLLFVRPLLLDRTKVIAIHTYIHTYKQRWKVLLKYMHTRLYYRDGKSPGDRS